MAAYENQSRYFDIPFVWSLRCTGYDGDIVLLVPEKAAENPTPEVSAFLKDFRVKLHPIRDSINVCPPIDAWDALETIDPRCLRPDHSRYFYYDEVISAYPDNRTMILLSDFRDVIFQVCRARK